MEPHTVPPHLHDDTLAVLGMCIQPNRILPRWKSIDGIAASNLNLLKDYPKELRDWRVVLFDGHNSEDDSNRISTASCNWLPGGTGNSTKIGPKVR